MNIERKVAIVTGGSSGLGQATAERILAAGGRVAIFDIDRQRGQAFAEAHAGKAIHIDVDVVLEESVRAGIRATLDAFGAIHICVNCAGVGQPRRASVHDTHSAAEFTRILQLHLVGTYNVTRLAGAQMMDNEPLARSGERGVIVNTAALDAQHNGSNQLAYSACTAGVAGMTRPLTLAMSTYGIRVCAIMPGVFDTPFKANLSPDARASLVTASRFPKREGDPAEFAALVGHIIENPYLNGEVIRLDGGAHPPSR
ncbi:SDR family NAD(P)-dependent oxidoreductase [Massilia niastensis]|uniref:SDR family NAD(P)-dependent oxidoreductase n=1 Tax=Massilia niastensis TaxID=544911 RepID=UPI0003724A9C|nr:SDR family NAD(P)-dependent oxidoreductase [Massilia niastensis]